MNSFLAILAGIISGLTFWFLGQMVFSSMFPYPSDIILSDRNSYQEFINSLPKNAFILMIIRNCLSIFTAGLVASIIGRNWRVRSGLVAALPFMTYFIVSDFKYTYPTYYVVIDIALIILLAFVSIFFGSTRVISD